MIFELCTEEHLVVNNKDNRLLCLGTIGLNVALGYLPSKLRFSGENLF